MFEHIENVLCDELEALNEKYAKEQEISSGDLMKADQVFHALKSLATYKAMKESGGFDEGRSERSYARSRTTGRYMSRDGMGRSGYPREMIDPYWDRR